MGMRSNLASRGAVFFLLGGDPSAEKSLGSCVLMFASLQPGVGSIVARFDNGLMSSGNELVKI